ncbi:MAG: DUF58 domain-containing protein [Sedimentisphaerales bacterium]|nr:DUF58 domain-containing protein [Sedimentisphaerales bacterium]
MTEFLDPIFLSKLANLELVARCAVEGFFSGLHPSPFQGFSVEYSDHREYHEGDEVKFVDWKVFARSDRLYIKRFQQETNTTAYLLLDTSRSMSFAGDGSISKIDYASYLTAALSYLMLRQCDSTALVLFAEKIKAQVPPASRRTHLNAILHTLEGAAVSGRTDLAAVLHAMAETTKRRGLIVLVSDLLDDQGDIFRGLAHLKFLKHDLLVFHVMDRQELHLDYEGLIEFEDLESKDKVRTFPQSVRSEYQRQVRDFLDDVKRTCGKNNIDYCLLNTSEPLDRALIAYLVKRRRMM